MAIFPYGVVGFDGKEHQWATAIYHEYPLRIDPGKELSKIFGRKYLTSPHTCILCGGVVMPNEITNEEHTIPKWLMRFTNSHNNQPLELLEKESDNITRIKTTFVSHAFCNSQFGEKIEIPGSKALKKIFSRDKISSKDILYLLNWMDKIRTTYYLSVASVSGLMRQLRFGLNNYPHIRVEAADRLVYLFRVDAFFDEDLYVFPFDDHNYISTPSCFAIRIFNLILISISDIDLIGDSLGLKNIHRLTNDGKFLLERKFKKISNQFTDKKLTLSEPLIIGQAIRKYYPISNIAASSHALHEDGTGRIFLYRNGKRITFKNGDLMQDEIPTLPHFGMNARIYLETKEWLSILKLRQIARSRALPKPANGLAFMQYFSQLENECREIRRHLKLKSPKNSWVL
ncbi:hypothetical protein [Aureimonas ureilytica]|uniref:hypothetical protein n=1 Tax=Aureimonas ureilytica TaxID=401562 RepID=UPI000AB243D9|nr:hypothetical protein [Aureimonas ureilytica]